MNNSLKPINERKPAMKQFCFLSSVLCLLLLPGCVTVTDKDFEVALTTSAANYGAEWYIGARLKTPAITPTNAPPVVTPTNPVSPVVSSDEAAHGLNLSAIQWQGAHSGAHAVIDRHMSSAYMPNYSSFNLVWDNDAATWLTGDGKGSTGFACAAWKDNSGAWVAAAYLENKPAGGAYNFSGNNTMAYYTPYPADGSEVAFFVLSWDCTKRSDCAFTTWAAGGPGPTDEATARKLGVTWKRNLIRNQKSEI